MSRNLANLSIIDIGGSKLNLTFEAQLPKAFAHEGDFPKEVAYTAGMEKWVAVADRSYQTTDEMDIIQATCSQIVSEMPSDTKIIDLGAANSKKYEPYVREFLEQGKSCTYIALDISRGALIAQIAWARVKFPRVDCIGLWGSFEDGDRFFKNISSARLFLSMGSIFYNAPDQIAIDRCKEFRQHLSLDDRLIIGQDGPTGAESGNSHASYQTKEFTEFFTRYLEGIQSHAGIVADPKKAWTFRSVMIDTEHYFEVTANQEMVCKNFNNLLVRPGTTYRMFPSWKRGEANIHELTTQEGLRIQTLGKAKNSGMRQYLVQAPLDS